VGPFQARHIRGCSRPRFHTYRAWPHCSNRSTFCAAVGYRGDKGEQAGVGDRDSGAYLHYYSWTKIVRHVPVPGRYSPDDPALAQYWADRRRKHKPPQIAETWQRDLRNQQGLCPLCGEPLLYVDRPPDSLTQWETWYRGIRKALAHEAITERGSGRTTRRLVHAHCARRHPDGQAQDPDQ
jgi:RNA-directed DNA polymerase